MSTRDGTEPTLAQTPAPEPRELRVGPLVVLALWTVYGIIQFTQQMLIRAPDAPPPYKPWGWIAFSMAHAWLWALLTPFIALVNRRVRPALTRPLTLLVHAVAVIAVHACTIAVAGVSIYFVMKQFFPYPFMEFYRRGLAQTIVLYATTSLAIAALDHARLARQRAAHAAKLEADLATARLETLRRQLQPHFLFNTLNTIASLIDTDPARAGSMIARLGTLLRRSLDEHNRALIPLQTELEFVRNYLQIEQVRFESWLSVVEHVDPAALQACVPPMIVQPLVENAIRHGISPSGRKGTLTIRAERTPDARLLLEVIDDGVGMSSGGNGRGGGIGLSTTRARVEHQFGAHARLSVTSGAHGGTRVTLDLPFVTARPSEAAAERNHTADDVAQSM